MEKYAQTPKARSKSSIKIIQKPLRKQETGEGLDKEVSKIQTYMRAYGRFPESKKFTFNKDAKVGFSPSKSNTPKDKKIQIPSKILETEKLIIKYPERHPDKDKIYHETLKAQSDKLELLRDLSTYEYNLISSLSLSYKSNKIQSFSYDIMSCYNEYKNTLFDCNSFATQILGIIKEPLKENFEETSKKLEFIENFVVKPRLGRKVIEDYQGVCVISGIKCVVSIKSKHLESHSIKCLLSSNENINLQLKKDLSSQVYKLNSYKQAINLYLIQFLYISTVHSCTSLIFDEQYGLSFVSF